jgi:hypothetical protein
MTHKKRNKLRNLMFCSAGCSLLRAEGFFCSLDVLYGGLGIGKLQILIKKILHFFSAVIFFNFWLSKPWIRIYIQPKMLDTDLDQTNTDSNTDIRVS